MSWNRHPDEDKEPADFEISDYDYIGSAVGNAFFSGVPFSVLWECMSSANTREKLDANVSAAIEAQEWLDNTVKVAYGRS